MILAATTSAILFFLSRSYKTSIRFSTLRELNGIFLLLIIKCLLLSLVIMKQDILSVKYTITCGLLDLFISSFFMISFRVFIVSLYYSILYIDDKPTNNVLVYGDSDYAPLLASQINNNNDMPYKVVGFLSRMHRKKGFRIAGLRVYNWDGDLDKLLLSVKQNITHIVFTNYVDFNNECNDLVYSCIEHNIQMLMGGEIHHLLDKKNIRQHIKNIEIEDLLQRDEITINVDAVSREVSGKTVLVTGAAGSIGREISTQLAQFGVKQLILLDIAETPLHNLELEMQKKFPTLDITFILSDVRSNVRIKDIFEHHKPNFVFHAAAYKHVPVMEDNPCEGVLTNIWGTINVARHSRLNKVEKFVMISTDKAVNPTSIMGATKRIAELCIQGLNSASNTQFITVRFGNVLGSNGSVIPLFKEQIANGGPVTVTHPEMIRYFMTIPEACRLVLQAATMGKGGEIFVFDMGEQVKIDNLARKMILLSGFIPDEDIKIEYTGLRPGEKLYEELLTEIESTQMTENQKIRIAQADRIDKKELTIKVIKLMGYAKKTDIVSTVRMMKQIVPEFKSNNSDFEVFDKEKLVTYK